MDEQHRESIGMVDKNGREIFVGDTLKVEELKWPHCPRCDSDNIDIKGESFWSYDCDESWQPQDLIVWKNVNGVE